MTEKNYKLEVANFVFKIGEKELLDAFNDWFYPTVTDGCYIDGRSYSETQKLFFHETEILIHGDEEPVLIGKLVKHQKLSSDQYFKDGKLIPDNKTLDTHPSSFFVLTLSNHKLLWVEETKRAPKVSDFQQIVKSQIMNKRREYIHEQVNQRKKELYIEFGKSNFRNDKEGKKEFDRKLDQFKQVLSRETLPHVEVTPLADQGLLNDRLKNIQVIKSIKIKFLQTNNELADENEQFLRRFQKTGEALGANSSSANFNGSKENPLDTKKGISIIKSSSRGTMKTDINATNKSGDDVTFNNYDDKVKVKKPIEQFKKSLSHMDKLIAVFDSFKNMVGKSIKIPVINAIAKKKALELVKSIKK